MKSHYPKELCNTHNFSPLKAKTNEETLVQSTLTSF